MEKKCIPNWIFILLLLLTCSFTLVEAQQLPDSTVNLRIYFLQKSLKSDQHATNQWWYGWLGGYSAATIGQGAVFFSSSDKGTRQDMALGAATTFAGVIGQFISPFQPGSSDPLLERLPEGDEVERTTKMRQMEQFLSDKSHLEIEARKWKAHVLCTGINLASGLVTWLGFHRTVWDGIANFGYNCIVTESQIWTQPIRAKRYLKHYTERFGQQHITLERSPQISWNWIITMNGVGVRMAF